jgi:hypothetical protein
MTEHLEAVPAWWPDAAACQQNGLLTAQLDGPVRSRGWGCLPSLSLLKKRTAIHVRSGVGKAEAAPANSLIVSSSSSTTTTTSSSKATAAR